MSKIVMRVSRNLFFLLIFAYAPPCAVAAAAVYDFYYRELYIQRDNDNEHEQEDIINGRVISPEKVAEDLNYF
jgi:hypothetical protein